MYMILEKVNKCRDVTSERCQVKLAKNGIN